LGVNIISPDPISRHVVTSDLVQVSKYCGMPVNTAVG